MAHKDTARTVGIVALGGLADITLEYITSKFAKQAVAVDKLNLNVADAVGLSTGVVGTLVGMQKNKPDVASFGAGALAAALATVLGKTFLAYNPIGASAHANSANLTYAGLTNPQPSPIAPPASPQQTLWVGNYGGHKVSTVYKPNLSAPACAGSNATKRQLFV